MKRDVVQVKRDSDEIPAGTFAEVLARGPDHLLVRPLFSDGRKAGRSSCRPTAVLPPRRIADVPFS